VDRILAVDDGILDRCWASSRTLEAVDPTSPTASTRALPEVTMQPDSDEASKVAMMMVRMMLSPSAIPWLSRSRMAQVAGCRLPIIAAPLLLQDRFTLIYADPAHA
jgi:hypothetical protein